MWLNETLKIKYPLIQGGMANIATGAFAAAVSNAGGLGLIAGGGMSPEMLRENIREAKRLTDKPFGVNLMLLHPQAGEMADIVVEENVPVVTTGAGNPGIYIKKWKEAGIIVMPVVPSVALARRMEKAGVDAVIAEGAESGGHVGLRVVNSFLRQLHLVRMVYRLVLFFLRAMNVLFTRTIRMRLSREKILIQQ